LPVELVERTDARAELEDRTRTQVIRRALREYLASEERKGAKSERPAA